MRKSNIKLVIKHISVLILSGLFVIAGGIAALAKSDGNKIYEAIIIVIFSLFLLYVIYLILKDIIGLIVSPEKQMAEIDSKMKTTEKFISNQSQNDLSVIKVIRQMPSLVVPYILFIILTAAFLISEFKLDIISSRLTGLSDSFWIFLLYLFIIFFVVFSLYTISYIWLGEIVQRKFLKHKNNIILETIIGYIYSIPFVILLSALWVIIVATKEKRRENDIADLAGRLSSGVTRLSLYLLTIVLKYYMFINLSMIALEDKKRYSWSESKQFIVEHKRELFLIWFRSGFMISMFIVFCVALIGLSAIIGSEILFAIGMLSFVLALFFAVTFGLYSEQLSFLLYFMRVRHNIDPLEQLKNKEMLPKDA